MAHTLTFNYDYPSSGYTVRKGSISGEYVHSPYTLQNGDELYFQTVKINNTINGTSYSWSDLENTTLEFTDVDINIVGASGPQIAIDGVPFVLKYTESTPQPTLTFKHFYDAGTIGSGTVKFRHYSQRAQLATPQNVAASGTIVSWGAVENATSYEILVSGSSFGTISTTSVDLSTLSGWASLTDGGYFVTVVAKADGYRDSEPSASVFITKSSVRFVQIFPTKASDGNTLLENLNQSKIYTIKTDEPFSYLMYDSGEWKVNNDDSSAGGIEIISQTANSVKIGVNIYRGYLSGYISGITLEGDVKATLQDFYGLSSTNVYAYYACLVEGTKITLSNGSTKPVQDIQYGDKVLCYDFANGVQTTSYIDWMIPERIATRYWEITLSDGTILNLVGSNGKSHRLYNITKQRFDYPQDFEADDLTLKEDGTTARVVSCKQIEKTVKFYNIASHEHINVYANGVLTSNRLNNRFKIVDNKFTDEKVMTDKEVEDYLNYLERIKAV